MKEDILVDYAAPCMKAERALKDLHDAMLMRDYEQAIEAALQALVETKLTLNAIKHERERYTEQASKRSVLGAMGLAFQDTGGTGLGGSVVPQGTTTREA